MWGLGGLLVRREVSLVGVSLPEAGLYSYSYRQGIAPRYKTGPPLDTYRYITSGPQRIALLNTQRDVSAVRRDASGSRRHRVCPFLPNGGAKRLGSKSVRCSYNFVHHGMPL